jgi:hypothetical protein
MADHGAVDGGLGRSSQDVAATARNITDPCEPIAEEIVVLEEQIAVLEEGLPGAPGMERAALFKEINEYRAALDARRQAWYRCRAQADAQA